MVKLIDDKKGQQGIRLLLSIIVLAFGLLATAFLTLGVAFSNSLLIGVGEILLAAIPLIIAIIGRYL